jgi:YidC/Oxa1 family membrane protein insertase
MDLGMVVIVLTIIIRLILLPLSKKSIKMQMKIKEIEPQMNEIKERLKDKKEEQVKEIMEMYKQHKINPFSSFFLVLIQIPVLLALYFVLLKGGLPEIKESILYSFVNIPTEIRMSFLGFFDITQRNFFLALLVGVTQYIHIKMLGIVKKEDKNKKKGNSFKDDLMKSMQFQMQYMMPAIVFFVSYTLPSMIALYWLTSNIFMIGQELVIKKRIFRSKI